MSFDFASVLRDDLPAPAVRWQGFPPYHFVGGNIDPEQIPVDALIAASERVLRREGNDLATYFLRNGSQGYLPLREYLVQKLSQYSAIEATPDDIMLVSGSSQAMDLINAAFLQAGDTVIIEESNYGGAISRLQRLGVSIETVPVDDDGMCTDTLRSILERLRAAGRQARYIYTVPTIHNPTGTIMTLARRQSLLALATEHNVVIYEDECYADLIFDGKRPPALYALDPARVVHIGTFSKTVAPALRVGYIVCDWSLMSRLLALKTDAGSGALEQMLLAEFCSEHFDAHLLALNARLRRKLEVLTQVLDEQFGTSASYTVPPGGMFLWIRFADPIDTTQLAAAALQAGVEINAGRGWSLGDDAGSWCRICFAHASEAQLVEGVTQLAEVCFEQFGVPQHGANRTRGT